jgi:DNA-binding MarR family transcriptional regulator
MLTERCGLTGTFDQAVMTHPAVGRSVAERDMRGETLPDFVQTEINAIEDQLRVLKDEASRLEAAHAALTGGARRRRRPATNGAAGTPARSASRGNRRSAASQPRRGGNTRANQALALVRERPGITIAEIAKAMKIEPNYLYRVLPRLASDGQVKRDGQGWHPAASSTSTRAEPVRDAPARRQTRATNSQPAESATRAARTRRTVEPTPATNDRTSRGATKASVLAALASGEAMTAGQVAAKAGLARPTVSTTLSQLAKTGRVQKAERGYRLPSTSD